MKRPTNANTATDQTHDGADVPEKPPADPVGPRLTIACTRSSSLTFPIVRRRLDVLSPLGSLVVGRDSQDRELSFELTLVRGLVPAARRIANLLTILRSWKTTEISLDGDLLSSKQQKLFIEHLDNVRLCWLRRKPQGPQACRRSSRLGCDALHLEPSLEDISPGYQDPRWFGVGHFDGQHVSIDKQALLDQVAGERNAEIRLCPFFDAQAVDAAIDGLPDKLSADDSAWTTLLDRAGKPVWLWPSSEPSPWGLHKVTESADHDGLHLRLDFPAGDTDAAKPQAKAPAAPPRTVPPTRYSDVLGQDAAVQDARDTIELPLKHADLFLRLGATPRGHGIVLAGPPGTGKTLLARAVAGECDAHIEIVNGPSLLSMWLGQTEAALRAIFDRARNFAPAVILFDEIDSIAPSRFAAGAQHDVSIVAQLLVLLDGLEERGQVFVLGTTNRPEQLDPALRRPGRLDQIIWMRLPDERGRASIFQHYLCKLKLAARIDSERLASDLAALAPGFSGADIAFVCHRAALLCVKEATTASTPPRAMAISRRHFLAALDLLRNNGAILPKASPASTQPQGVLDGETESPSRF